MEDRSNSANDRLMVKAWWAYTAERKRQVQVRDKEQRGQ
jgi:hypothetical protein